MQTFFFLPFSVMCQHKQFVADFIKNTPAAHSLHSQLIEEQTQLNRSQAFINTANGEFDAKLKIFHEVAADSAHGFAWQLSVTRALLSEQVKLLISATLPWYKSIPLKAVKDGQCDSWLGAADRWLNVTVVEGSIMLANAASEGQVDNLHFRNLIRAPQPSDNAAYSVEVLTSNAESKYVALVVHGLDAETFLNQLSKQQQLTLYNSLMVRDGETVKAVKTVKTPSEAEITDYNRTAVTMWGAQAFHILPHAIDRIDGPLRCFVGNSVGVATSHESSTLHSRICV